MMRKLFEKSGTNPVMIFITSLVIMFSLTGCLQPKENAKSVATTSSWFAGATAAQNIGGYPTSIKISWARADRSVLGYKIYSLRPNPTTGNNEWKEVAEVDGTQTDFKDTQDLLDGTVYTYKVQAIDALTNAEDGNDKQVSTVTFYGISGVTINSKTSATVALNGLAGAFDSIHIYATPKKGSGTRTLVATVKGNPEQVVINGLKSGVNYNFSANAYMSFLGAEDGNVRTVPGQTWSDSYGSGITTDTNYYYRGVLNVQGYGDAPNATAGPTSRQINLIWLPFSNATSATKYKVVRSTTTAVDTTVTTACTSSVKTSCLVCTVTGSQKCEDKNVGAPPQSYFYAITVEKTDASGASYTEELPCQNGGTNCSMTDFLVTAHVPPDYMVLVHRDSANYEMCLNINASSDPRHKQRCVYYGLGAVPSTTGPNKPVKTYDSGYYDFGYNLFVDRYKTACNWTKSSSACGPNGCVDILATDASFVAPPSSSGNIGDVFYGFHASWWTQSSCFIKTASGWNGVGKDNTTLTAGEVASAVTNDPGPADNKHRPPLAYLTVAGAKQVCNSQMTDYGSKRLLRHREYIVATPLPYIYGEDNYSSSAFTWNAPSNATCNPTSSTNSNHVVTLNGWLDKANSLISIFFNSTTWLNSYDGYLSLQYFIGSSATSSCLSRFGIQDPLGFGVIFSDAFIRLNGSTLPPTIQGSSSDYDAGNMDHGNFSFNGTLGPAFSGSSSTYYYNQSYSGSTVLACSSATPASQFIPPLGLPVCTWSGGLQSLRTITEYEKTGALGSWAVYGSGVSTSHQIANDSVSSYIMTSGNYGRFSNAFVAQAGGSNSAKYGNLFCAVEAE